MAKKLLVVGSLAFDHLMHYEGVFQEKILPEHLHTLSVSFGVPSRKITFGGCGGNIAFHFKKLGGEPLLYGLAGKDFSEYETWLNKHGVDTSTVSKKANFSTSAAFVVTDSRGHQIAIFDEGAAHDFSFNDLAKLRNAFVTYRKDIGAAIISPTNYELMKTAALMCQELSIPYFFDPGQALIAFSRKDLRALIEKASGLFTNEYEMQVLLKETGYSRSELEEHCDLVVETLGEKGSMITFRAERIFIEPVPVKKIVDPTGCGDAYRAGFLYEWLKKNEIEKAGFFGSQLGSYVLTIAGTQG